MKFSQVCLHSSLTLLTALSAGCVAEPEVLFGSTQKPLESDDQEILPSDPPAQEVDETLHHLQTTCRAGTEPIYQAIEGEGQTVHYIPIECETAEPDTVLGGACASVLAGTDSYSCLDLGHGFTAQGTWVESREEGDIPVPQFQHPSQENEWSSDNGWHYNCQAGGVVIGTFDCGEVPEGLGGIISPGTYALTAIVEYGTPSFNLAENMFRQTLLVTGESMALLSDDNTIFGFQGAYLYNATGNEIIFTEVSARYSFEESPQWVPFTQSGTFSASTNRIDIYSPSRGYSATFVRMN